MTHEEPRRPAPQVAAPAPSPVPTPEPVLGQRRGSEPPIVGPLHEVLARAIARIGELDVTRTLPGRLVWYHDGACRLGQEIGWPCTCNQDRPSPVVHVRINWPTFEPVPEPESAIGQLPCQGCHRPRHSTDATGYCFTCRCVGVPIKPLPAPPDPTRQGGLEAWNRANGDSR